MNGLFLGEVPKREVVMGDSSSATTLLSHGVLLDSVFFPSGRGHIYMRPLEDTGKFDGLKCQQYADATHVSDLHNIE